MPTYDYRCTKCKHVFEVFHSMKDDAPRKCPRCKARAAKVPGTGAGLLFKGSGFYITDYRSSAYQDKAKQDKAAGSTPPAGDAKPAAATPASGAGSTPSAPAAPAATAKSPRSGRGRSRPTRSKPSSR